MLDTEKPLIWIGSSYKDLVILPDEVKRGFGYALSLAQSGLRHSSTKILQGFGGSGVIEIIENNQGGTYRAVYTVNYVQAIFVLHCFQKKSKKLCLLLHRQRLSQNIPKAQMVSQIAPMVPLFELLLLR